MIRVAFVLPDLGNDWLGGVNYYRNLLTALQLLQPTTIQPVLFVGSQAPQNFLDSVGNVEIVRTALFDRASPLGFIWRVARKLPAGDGLILRRLLGKHRIDVLSHYGPLPFRGAIRTASWIPDFQHLQLPQFFSAAENRRRTAEFRRMCRHSDVVILSSAAAQQHLQELEPDAISKARVLRFVPDIPVDGTGISAAYLEQRYHFQGPYFHLPNQFWTHKNHDVIVEALHRLQISGQTPPLVIATGRQNDYRNPAHYPALMDKVRRLGLQDRFLSLGVIPYSDMLTFMQHATAVINPSLFEGWSSTVEEAKYLNKRILLSDLPVHREQNPPASLFFAPHDADAAAAALTSLSSGTPAELSLTVAQRRQRHSEARLGFAYTYQYIVDGLVAL